LRYYLGVVLDPEVGVEVLQEQGHSFIHYQVSQIVLNKPIFQQYLIQYVATFQIQEFLGP
jgi:hypothetical protein